MNYVLLVVLLILAVCVIRGLIKGFVDMVFSACSMIVALILAIVLTSPIADAVQKSENVMDKLTTKIEEAMNLEELAENIPDTEEFMAEVNLPEVIKEKVMTEEFLDKIEWNSAAENATQVMANAISEFLAKVIIYAIVFIVLFIVAQIALSMAGKVLDLVTKLPVLKQANKIIGVALGLVQGLLIVWILFAFVTAFGSTAFGHTLFGYINDNAFLSFLYNNNIPLSFITNKVEGLF